MPGDVIEKHEGRHVFGRDPGIYDASRPGHHDRVYEVLVERCGLSPERNVLEIGPGTGQATRRLLELGARSLVAVEPDPALAAYLQARLDRVEILAAPLEEADLPLAAFDLAVAASSFHWVEEDIGLAKIAEALRPGGWWAMWWTLFGDDSRPDPFRDALDPIMGDLTPSPHERSSQRPRFPLDVETRRTALSSAGFEPADHEVIPWSFTWDAYGIRGPFSTFSPIARLDEPPRTAVLDEIARIARDDFGGRVTKPLLTSLYTARRP